MNINTKGMREWREGESEKERESQGIGEKNCCKKWTRVVWFHANEMMSWTLACEMNVLCRGMVVTSLAKAHGMLLETEGDRRWGEGYSDKTNHKGIICTKNLGRLEHFDSIIVRKITMSKNKYPCHRKYRKKVTMSARKLLSDSNQQQYPVATSQPSEVKQ